MATEMKTCRSLAALLLFTAVLTAQAGLIVVDTVDDSVNTDGLCSLREALTNAQNADQTGSVDCAAGGSGQTTIRFAPSLAGQVITLNLGELPMIKTDLLIAGPVADQADGLIIEAQGLSRVLTIRDADVLINGLTFSKGTTETIDDAGGALRIDSSSTVRLESVAVLSSTTQGSQADGGAIAVFDSELTLFDSDLAFNGSARDGGALHAVDSVLVLINSRVTANASAGRGGGLNLLGGQLTLTNSQVNDNQTDAHQAFGGGMYVRDADVEMNSSEIRLNRTLGTSSSGGGLYLRDGDLVMSGGQVTANQVQSSSGNGGGISVFRGNVWLQAGCQVSLNATLQDNSPGGGVRVSEGDLAIEGCQISGNETLGENSNGGGLLVLNGNAVITASQITDNQTAGGNAHGGGLRLRHGELSLSDSLVQGNRTVGDSASGGGLYLRDCAFQIVESQIRHNATEGSLADGGGLYALGCNGPSLIHATWVGDNKTLGNGNGGGLVLEGGNHRIERSAVVDNESGQTVGGVRVVDASLLVENSTLSGNQAAIAQGKTLHVFRGDVELRHVTVRQETVGQSGIYIIGQGGFPAELRLFNSLLVNENCSVNGVASSSGSSSLATEAGCPAMQVSVSELNLGPRDSAGEAPFYPLVLPSQAINAAGDCNEEFDVTSDQRGQLRPGTVSTACDAGAYEYDGPPPPTDLSLVASASASTVSPGQTVNVLIQLDNLALNGATGVEVDIELGVGLSLVDATPGQGSVGPGCCGSLLWTVGKLLGREQASLVLAVEVVGESDLLVSAEASGNEPDPQPGNNVGTVQFNLAAPGIVVTTLVDSTAADGLCSLREAIRNANAAGIVGNNDCAPGQAEGNVITFAPELAGGAILLGGDPLPTITRSLEIQASMGPQPAVILDGNSQSRLFRVSGEIDVVMRHLSMRNGISNQSLANGGIMVIENGARVTLEQLSISGGLAGGNLTRGGGIAVIDSELTLAIVTFEDNESALTAGALYVRDSHLSVVDSNFVGNRSNGGSAVELIDSQATFIRTIFFGNEQVQVAFNGGAIRSLNSDLVLVNAWFEDNSANAGAAVWAEGGELTVRSSQFENNLSLGSGILTFAEGNFLIEGTTFLGNSVSGVGAGAFSLTDATGRVINSTLSGNSTGSAAGGALRLTRSQVELIHSTVANNSSPGNEVFIFGSAESPARLDLINSLVVGNRCQAGQNSQIVSLNSLSDSSGCTPQTVPTELINLQPLDSALAFTSLHALGGDSIAIDAAGDCLSGLDLVQDQRGLPRPAGDQARCDVGAYEYQGPSPKADISLGLALSSSSVEAGQSVTLTVQLDQAGPSPAGQTVVTLSLPSELAVSHVQPGGGSFNPDSAEWTVPPLGAGSSSQLSLTLLGGQPGSYPIAGHASSYTLDPELANNQASTVLQVNEAGSDRIFNDRFEAQLPFTPMIVQEEP